MGLVGVCKWLKRRLDRKEKVIFRGMADYL